MDRYLRHRAIEGFSQPDLQASRFAVIGAGAIGNEVIKNLCLLGVGAIDVYDFDTIELHNLTRSVLLRETDVGAPKAVSVARRAREIDPAVTISAIEGDLWRTLGFAALRSYRCVIGALDNFEARVRLNLLCWIAGTDWVNAAIDSRFVTVESFPFSVKPGAAAGVHDPACYECGLPPTVYQRIAERYSCGGLQRAAARERVVPTTAITAAFAGAEAVNRALGLKPRAAQAANPWGGASGNSASGDGASKRWLLDTGGGMAAMAGLTRTPGCPGCGSHPRAAEISAVPGATAAAIDQAARACAAQSIRLSDALIWHCRCANCGATDATRAAELQAAGRVPDSIVFCAQCRSDAISVEIRDEFGLGELTRRFGPDAAVPSRFALAGEHCLDLHVS